MVLAMSGGAYLAVIAGYLAIVLIAFLIWPRDVTGRKRALGCIGCLVIFFGLFVVAFAAWAADNIF